MACRNVKTSFMVEVVVSKRSASSRLVGTTPTFSHSPPSIRQIICRKMEVTFPGLFAINNSLIRVRLILKIFAHQISTTREKPGECPRDKQSEHEGDQACPEQLKVV